MSRVFDDLARVYETPSNRAFYESIAGELLCLLQDCAGRPPEHILEVGCGTGLSTCLLAAGYPHACITACDESPDMLRSAKLKDLPGNVSFIQSSVERLPDMHCDCIFGSMCLHWLSPSALRSLAVRLPAPGPAVFSVPLADPSSSRDANRLLMATLKALRRELSGRRAPGAYPGRLADYVAPFRITDKRYMALEESYSDGSALCGALHSRGVLRAIFGDAAEKASDIISSRAQGKIRMEWKIALLAAQSPQAKASSAGE